MISANAVFLAACEILVEERKRGGDVEGVAVTLYDVCDLFGCNDGQKGLIDAFAASPDSEASEFIRAASNTHSGNLFTENQLNVILNTFLASLRTASAHMIARMSEYELTPALNDPEDLALVNALRTRCEADRS